MKHKFLMLALMLCGSLGAIAGDVVPGITVEYVQEGTPDYKVALSTIGRLQFDGGQVSILFSNGDTYSLGAVGSMRRILFGAVPEQEPEKPTTNDATTRPITVSAFPNPVANVLHVTGQEPGETIRLVAEDGRVVAVTTNAEVPVAGLQPGVYFLQCGAQVVKVVKK